ncbi:MAG: hypothetical protein Hens3KO_05210 [Henriciella sp.]
MRLKRRDFLIGSMSLPVFSVGGCRQSRDMQKLGNDLFEYLNANQKTGNRTAPTYGVPGMTLSEIASVEAQLDFPLPSDLKFLLENVQDPGGVLFPWSDFSIERYQEMIDFVWRGISFDIEHNALWLEKWGQRPSDLTAAKALAKKDFQTWPRLLPIYGHRFLAADPCLPDNPVFSIMQTDIIYYGTNLADYLLREFCPGRPLIMSEPLRRIPIWSDFAERTDGFTLPYE